MKKILCFALNLLPLGRKRERSICVAHCTLCVFGKAVAVRLFVCCYGDVTENREHYITSYSFKYYEQKMYRSTLLVAVCEPVGISNNTNTRTSP